MVIEEVVSYMRKIERRYPGIEVYFENQLREENRGNFPEIDLGYITTLDLDEELNPAAVNIPVT